MNIQEAFKLGQSEYIKANTRKPQPRYVNRVSDIGHPCARYLYHARVDWQSRKEIGPYLFGIFDTGTVLEEFIRRNFNDYGRFAGEFQFRIVGDQAPTRDAFLAKYKIQGTCDGTLQILINGGWVSLGAIDIKTMNPNIFDSIQTLEDLDRYEWTKKYKSQVMIYSFADNLDKSYLLLANKSNLHDMKLLEVPLDYQHVEGLIQKAQAVNTAVDALTPPEKINRPDICLRCDFEAVCCPAVQTGQGFDILEDDELTAIIDQRNQLAEAKKEYDSLDTKLKARLIKGKDILCGNYLIQWSNYVKKSYVVPEGTVYRMKIISTEAEKETE